MMQLSFSSAEIFKMPPENFIQLTGATYTEIAEMCDRPYATVAKWFCRGKCHRNPSPQDLKILKLEYQMRSSHGSI